MLDQIQPVAKALKKHKGTAGLLICLIAIAVAVITNCATVIGSVVQQAHIATGIDEDNVVVIQDIAIVGSRSGTPVSNKLAELKRLPYVSAAAFGAAPLMSDRFINVGTDSSLERSTAVHFFQGSQGYPEALGVTVIEGRTLDDLSAPDVGSPGEAPALITQALRRKLFGSASGIGRLLYAQAGSFRVVGVVKEFRGCLVKATDCDLSLLSIQKYDRQDMGGLYVVRSTNEKAKYVLAEASLLLHKLNPYHAQPYASTFLDIKRVAMGRRVALAHALTSLVVILTAITFFTIGSITSLWVRQRRTQAGIRRALGATKSHILYYFLIENSLIVGAGLCLGLIAACALNAAAMRYLEIPLLSPSYCAASVTLIFVLSQLSALGPACRASAQAPAQVIRNQ